MSASVFLEIYFEIHGFNFAGFFTGVPPVVLQILNAEMITSSIITEHVIKCLLVISFLFISVTFGRMFGKGKLYKSDYQILSFSQVWNNLVFGSKTALESG